MRPAAPAGGDGKLQGLPLYGVCHSAVRQGARYADAGDEKPLPGGGEAVLYHVAGGGAEYSDGDRGGLEAESRSAGRDGGQLVVDQALLGSISRHCVGGLAEEQGRLSAG